MYSIGLDIGIASTGWSVINSETGRIVDLGVNLFKARNSENNSERRDARGSRRLNRRRITRLNDAKNILEKIEIKKDKKDKHSCPYKLRVKGLEEKLTKSEIYIVVTHIVKKRGISYLDDESQEATDAGQNYKAEVNRNAQLLKKHTPGEIQLKRLREDGRVRTGINNKGEYQLNVFTVQAYADELKRILKTQQVFYPEITDEVIDRFVGKGLGEKAGLVYRRRPYYHGPGNKNNNSPYGRWVDYKEEGKPKNNIFDQLIGKDLLDELRASNLSLTAQKFNLLNDLNNLEINRETPKVTTEEKNQILNYLIKENVSRFGPTNIANILDVKMEDIKGWRIDKKEKPLIHSLKSYRDWRKTFRDYDIELNDVPTETIDSIAKIVTLNTEKDAIINTLNIELPYLSDELRKVVINEFHVLRKKGNNKSWHNFSVKLMNILIPELLNTNEEQNTVLERLDIKRDLRDKYVSASKVPIKDVVKEIYNPTVSKSVRQALTVFNELVKRYGKENISHLTIEMPRDKNEQDQKDTIKKIQKNNKERKEKSEKYFINKSGWNSSKFNQAMSTKGFAVKLQYYYEQDGKCAYSGKPIKPDSLLTNKVEIDHIIPLSISLDDSINNKVLVTANANQEKGQRSPYQAFNDGAKLGRTWSEYKSWVLSRNYKRYKKELLLEERDIFNPKVRNKFIARNLNDTRYASRVVLNVLQSYFYKSKTKVQVITGSFTHTLRKKWGNALEKTRDTHYHHAVDATLCAVTPFIQVDRFKYYIDKNDKKYMIDQNTGEKISYRDYKKMYFYDRRTYTPKWENFIERLIPRRLYPRVKFSHQVDRKFNRKVSDATLYSTRTKKETITKRGKEVEKKEIYVIDYIKDIYTVDGWKAFEKYHDKLLMKDKDRKTYEILMEIADTYPNFIEEEQANGKVKRVNRSPFRIYCETHSVPAIKKYSKKGNGPAVRKVKYYSKKLGMNMNVTKDPQGNSIEKTKKDKKVVLRNQNPWRTDVYYNPSNDCFELLGIKYNHLKYVNGKYGVPINVYENLKLIEKIGDDSEFCFSLYRNSLITIKFDDEVIDGLFQSRNDTSKNYFEMKPIHKSLWDKKEKVPVFGNVAKSGQFIKSIKPHMKLNKYHTNSLGEKFKVKNEKLKNIIR